MFRDLGFFLDCLLKMDSTSTRFVANCIHYSKTYTKYDHVLAWIPQNNNTSTCCVKLEYCNSLLAGTAGYQLDKLQCIHNMACRVVTKLHKFDHINENMMTLHWLKIHERIMFKILLLVYKCRCGLAPKYLQDLPRPNKTRTLCPSYTTVMVPEFFKKEQPKSSSFSAVGPHIWSTLPIQVKTSGTLEAFKTSLKTYLFKKSYNITEGPDNSNG